MTATIKGMALTSVMLLALAGRAAGMGTEHLGSEPFPDSWGFSPSLKALADLPSRVYWREVNGDVHFFYRGDADALNEALRRFAALGGQAREVIVRPGPLETSTFEGRKVPCDWEFHVPGGLVLNLLGGARSPEGEPIFPTSPRLIVGVGEAIPLDAVEVPEGVTIVELDDLKDRYLGGLQVGLNVPGPGRTKGAGAEGDHARATHVRGLAAFALGELAPLGATLVPPLVACLDDPEPYVRQCAAGALGAIGPAASDAVPALRALLEAAPDEPSREAYQNALGLIQRGTSDPDADRAALEAIHAFRLAHEKT